MSKAVLFALVGLLAVTLIVATAPKACGRHGDICSGDRDCCDTTKCNAYAGRCQVQITPEELRAQFEKIKANGKNKQLYIDGTLNLDKNKKKY